jgi:hypothetical protein
LIVLTIIVAQQISRGWDVVLLDLDVHLGLMHIREIGNMGSHDSSIAASSQRTAQSTPRWQRPLWLHPDRSSYGLQYASPHIIGVAIRVIQHATILGNFPIGKLERMYPMRGR